MSKRDDMLREILKDPEIMRKYDLREKEMPEIKAGAPYKNKLIEVLATIINEHDNGRSSRQIYSNIKNIHKI